MGPKPVRAESPDNAVDQEVLAEIAMKTPKADGIVADVDVGLRVADVAAAFNEDDDDDDDVSFEIETIQ